MSMSMSEWPLDEDPELLGATLSLVAQWDQHVEELSSSASVSDGDARTVSRVAVKTETTKARKLERQRPRQRINISRERRKKEIEALRHESQELEDLLKDLQQRRERMLQAHYNGHAIQSTAPVWERLARRQLQACKRSQKSNEKLRAQVVEQTRVARGLMEAMELAMQRQSLHELTRTVCLPSTVNQRMSQTQQLARLHANFHRWQWALSLSPRFESGELLFKDFRVTEADQKTATMDAYASYVLPYPVASVARVGWSIFLQQTSGFDEDDAGVDKYVQEHTASEEEIIASFSIESTMGGATASQGRVFGTWVARQEALHGGAQHLINTQWRYEYEGFGNELDGISVVEDTWLRLVDAKDIGHTTQNEPLTVMQLVSRYNINLNPSQQVDQRHVATVTQLMKNEVIAQLKEVERGLENALMVESVTSKESIV